MPAVTTFPSTAEVVIIGGGAVGLSVAYALAQRGVAAVVLERARVGSGASSGTACMITPSHSDRTASPAALRDGLRFLLDPKAPLKLRPKPSELAWVARFTAASLSEERAEEGTQLLRELAIRSTQLHREWSEQLGTGLEMNGTLNLWSGPDAEAKRAAVVKTARDGGLEMEELDAAQIAALEPSVRGATHGALATGDGHVDSLRFTECLAVGVRALDGTIIEEVEVLHIDRSGPRIRLATTRGAITCERVVLAAGVGSRRFAEDVGTALPITPAKGYHVEFADAVGGAPRPL